MQTQDAIQNLRRMLDEEAKPRKSGDPLRRETTEEQEAKQRALVMVGLALLENFLSDLRRSADALERLAEDQRELDNYRRCYGSMKYGPET